MARSKRTKFQNFVIIAGVLVGVELLFIAYHYFTSAPAMDIRSEIQAAVDKKWDLDDRRRAQLKVQLAVADFQSANGGKLPASLQELIPKYFDDMPVDPATSAPFDYRIDKGRPIIGKAAGPVVASLNGGGGGGVEAPMTDSEQASLIASLTETKTDQFVYDPTGKRDPFMPFDFSPKHAEGENLTPLERYSLGQLKLTAVLQGFDEPAGLVEDQAGKGFTVKKGTKIGDQSGVVVEVLPDKLLVLETVVDFTGEKKTRTVEMKMLSKEENK